MHIDTASFNDYPDAGKVLRLLQSALKNLCGRPDKQGKYAVPRKLHPLAKETAMGEPGRLLPNYRSLWLTSYIVFSPTERGASVRMSSGKISFGPYFTKGWKVRDIEKVILHEYLHRAVSMQPDFGPIQFRKDAQHGEIDHIITYELKYPGNPRGSKLAVD